MNMSTAEKLKVAFSKVTYKQVAPYVWLNPNGNGQDIRHIDVFRSRVPTNMFAGIMEDVKNALTQYGPLESHDNEETRSRFISSVKNSAHFI
jgi:hypothetical protein